MIESYQNKYTKLHKLSVKKPDLSLILRRLFLEVFPRFLALKS